MFELGMERESASHLLTHDRDFGRLSLAAKRSTARIIYLRPGHILPQFTIDTLLTIEAMDLDLSPSFILVARRRANFVRVRLRRY